MSPAPVDGIQQVLAVLVTHARGADRTVERHAGNGERGGSAQERGNVRIDLGIDGKHGRDDLHVVVEAIRKQRADRTVDEARGEGFLLGRPAFAFEKAAGNASRSVVLFDIVHGERKEVPPRRGRRFCAGGNEYYSIAHGDTYGAFGLAGHLARLDRDRVGAVWKGPTDNAQATFLEVKNLGAKTQRPRVHDGGPWVFQRRSPRRSTSSWYFCGWVDFR